jgi:hypothetical protein
MAAKRDCKSSKSLQLLVMLTPKFSSLSNRGYSMHEPLNLKSNLKSNPTFESNVSADGSAVKSSSLTIADRSIHQPSPYYRQRMTA